MGNKTCQFCEKSYDVDQGKYIKEDDEFFCYNCVTECSRCDNIVAQDIALYCDYNDKGVICDNPLHEDCAAYDEKLGWLCKDHEKHATQ